MAPPRFRSRATHSTVVEAARGFLTDAGWLADPVNFGTDPVKVLDYQPDERGEKINVNTVAITLGDVPSDTDEELGAAHGGLRSMAYPVFFDIYMVRQALSVALADDLRDAFTDLALKLRDEINGGDVPGVIIHIEDIVGPQRPPAASTNEQFKRYWRVLSMSAVLYFNS